MRERNDPRRMNDDHAVADRQLLGASRKHGRHQQGVISLFGDLVLSELRSEAVQPSLMVLGIVYERPAERASLLGPPTMCTMVMPSRCSNTRG